MATQLFLIVLRKNKISFLEAQLSNYPNKTMKKPRLNTT